MIILEYVLMQAFVQKVERIKTGEPLYHEKSGTLICPMLF